MRAAAVAALALLGACVQVRYSRTSAGDPLPSEVVAQVREGDDLARCLALLGAPREVWKDARGSFALAYGWLDTRGWGVSVSAPTDLFVSPFVRFDREKQRWRGVVLHFDAAGRLRSVREGLLTAGAVPDDVFRIG